MDSPRQGQGAGGDVCTAWPWSAAQPVCLSRAACLAPWAAGPVTPDLGTLHCARAPRLPAQPHRDPAFPRAGPRLPLTSWDSSSGLSCHGPGGANDKQGQGAGGPQEDTWQESAQWECLAWMGGRDWVRIRNEGGPSERRDVTVRGRRGHCVRAQRCGLGIWVRFWEGRRHPLPLQVCA